MGLAGKQPICNMRKLLILSCFALLSGALQGQTLWGGYWLNMHSANSDSLTTFNASSIRGFSLGNAFTQFAGASSSIKTYTLPNASCNILTSNAAVTVVQGGTGTTSLTGLLQGNGTGAFSAITNSTTVGQTLRVTASNTYAWGALDLADADAVTGALPYGNGGRDVVTGRVTAQTATVATIATVTVGGSDASYMVSGNIVVTTSSAESLSLQVSYTDENSNSRTCIIPIIRASNGAMLTATISATGAVPYPGIDVHIRCKAGTAITIGTVGTVGGCTYNADAKIERI